MTEQSTRPIVVSYPDTDPIRSRCFYSHTYNLHRQPCRGLDLWFDLDYATVSTIFPQRGFRMIWSSSLDGKDNLTSDVGQLLREASDISAMGWAYRPGIMRRHEGLTFYGPVGFSQASIVFRHGILQRAKGLGVSQLRVATYLAGMALLCYGTLKLMFLRLEKRSEHPSRTLPVTVVGLGLEILLQLTQGYIILAFADASKSDGNIRDTLDLARNLKKGSIELLVSHHSETYGSWRALAKTGSQLFQVTEQTRSKMCIRWKSNIALAEACQPPSD